MSIIFNEIFKESFGTTVTFQFKNYISITGNNEEQRIAQWDQPLLTFDLSREVVTQQELDSLLAFHQQQKGQELPFLYLDPFDNGIDRLVQDRFYVNDNNVHYIYTEGTINQVGVNRYKLQKKYIGKYDPLAEISLCMSARNINYPFNIVLYDSNNEITLNWSWNSETKEIETTENLSYWCRFNFYVPVRFGQDEIEYNFIGYDGVEALYSIPKITLIEVRETNNTNYNNTHWSHLDYEFNLDGFADSNSLFESSSIIEVIDSGFEQRENNNSNLFKITLGERVLSPEEVNYLILLYRVARGTVTTFNFIDLVSSNLYLVRFDSDLTLKLESETECGVLASCNSLTLKEVNELSQSVLVSNYNLTFQEAKKYDLYYGFSSANGAEYSEAKVIKAFLNGQQFIGGGNIPKTVNGYASLASINSEVILVPNQKETVGSCFVSSPLDNNFNIHNFSVFFVCNISADGLAFILHGQSTGANAIGVMSSALGNSVNYLTTAQILATSNIEGKSLGYVGISPSIVVELDGYQNEFDPNNNHIGVNINGSLSSYSFEFPSFDLKATSNVSIWIDYVNPILKIYANNSETKPTSPLIETSLNIPDYLGYYQESVPIVLDSENKGMGVQTCCYCWKITRKDGVILGTTNHDKDIYIDGVLYKANGGFSGSAIETDYELTVDNAEIKSYFVNNLITEQDIVGGKYDEAEVILYLVNWNSFNIISVLQSGIVGQISHSNRTYTLEVRNIFELLTKKNSKKTSSNCPLVFGETGPLKCNKDLTGLTTNTVVTTVENNKEFTIGVSFADHYFDYGTVEFLSGLNAGIILDIFSFQNNTVVLWQNAPYPVSINDSIKITKGCEKSLNACKAYNNVENFGGDPFVPGADTYLTGALEYSNPID